MRDFIGNQFANYFLWTPFMATLGAVLYFVAGFEPYVPCAAIFAVGLFIAMLVPRVPIFIRAPAVVLFGFVYAAAYTDFVATPKIARNMRSAHITATVADIDYTSDKTRLYMDVAARDIGADADGVARVRVSVADGVSVPNIGDTIVADVGLFYPGGADAPGTFDYARWAYFNGLSATGYLDKYETMATGNAPGAPAARRAIHGRAKSMLTDALVLGYKNVLDADSRAVWTNAGVGHIWSISGFHMTLLSGWMFAIFYLMFRLVPYVTRRVPARIPATVLAWLGLAAYVFISGAGIATIRAFLMTSLVFMGLVLGRNVFSMRNIAMAFWVVFLINPHHVMQAGFQLSFSAVFGMVWFWNTYPWLPRRRILRIAYAAIMTSIVATLFTMPFVAMNFGSVPIYSLVGNMILLPIFSVAIMPLAVIGTVAAMFGVMWPLGLAGNIYDMSFGIATWISGLPHAAANVPQIPGAAMFLVVLGGLLLMFIRAERRWINAAMCGGCMMVAIVVMAVAPRPVFMTTADNELIAFYRDGNLEFNKSRASNHHFTFDTWKQMLGHATGTPNPRIAHDSGIYRMQTHGVNLVYVQKYVPLAREIGNLCRDESLDYIVSYLRVSAPNCHARILHGGFVIYENGRVRFTNSSRRWHHRNHN